MSKLKTSRLSRIRLALLLLGCTVQHVPVLHRSEPVYRSELVSELVKRQ